MVLNNNKYKLKSAFGHSDYNIDKEQYDIFTILYIKIHL